MSSLYSRSSKTSAINYITNLQYSGNPRQSTKMMSHRLESAKTLFRKDLYAHYGCVNAVEFSNDGEWLVSGGDDKRVLIWNMDKTLSNRPNPTPMKAEHNSNIFCLSFDNTREKLFSAGNDEQVILHDASTGETVDVFLHDEAVYGLSVDPQNRNLFASACDDGRILIWDVRCSTADATVLADCGSAFHAVMHNPVESRLLASANAKEGVGLWDMRKPGYLVVRYGGSLLRQGAMSVRFNCSGTHVLSLRRRLPPVLYEIQSSQHVAQFDHKEYYNSCTMKSCCFAGDRDEYVLSGSDDFKLYMWKVPKDISTNKGVWINDAHLVMKGHRSIVNQVRYNYTYGMFASSGVEKIIKLWSSYPINVENYGSDMDDLRRVYSHEEYINLVLESGQFMTHDYSHHSVQEDPRMMAFFDSLVQRDIEGWTSDSSDDSTKSNVRDPCFEVQTTASSSSASDTSSSDEDSSSVAVMQYSSGLNFSTTLCPRLGALTGDNHPECGPELENLTSDKISQLIAQKRHNQMVKSARSTLKLKRLLRQIKKHIKTRVNGESTRINPSSTVLHDARTVLTVAIQNRIDRRKMLQRKRARLLRVPTISDNSSDSEDSTTESSSAKNTSDLFPENGCTSNPRLQESDDATLTPDPNENAKVESKNASNDSKNESNSLVPQTTEMEETTSLSQDPQPTPVFFQSRNGKRHSRNYRKRNIEDAQDEP